MLNIRSPSYQRAKAQSYGRDRDTDKELYAPVTVAKAWKQLECPLTEEWIKKMWCINTMEYYSAIKNEIGLPLWLSGKESTCQRKRCRFNP